MKQGKIKLFNGKNTKQLQRGKPLLRACKSVHLSSMIPRSGDKAMEKSGGCYFRLYPNLEG
jgi:hypothetical protein